MTFILLGIVLLLVVACGIFVAAEFSFITINRPAIERLAAKGDKRAGGVLVALKSLSTQLSGAQVGITVTNLAIGLLAQPLVASVIDEPLKSFGMAPDAIPGISLAVSVVAATVVTMVFGELVPKNLAIAKPLSTAKFVQQPQRWFSAVMKYPIQFLNGSANYMLAQFGVKPQEELASARSADELTALVRRSAEKGTLPQETADMLERSLMFDELTALDVMTPRIRMRTVSVNDHVTAIIDLAKTTGLSRFPVAGKGLDDIVGLVHVKQAVAVPSEDRGHHKVSQIMRPPLIVPSSVQLDSLLDTLRKGGLHMAIVIDEFGGTDGVVTMEDLLEELIGEVRDEHDRMGPSIRQRSAGVWALSGLLRPDEIAQQLEIALPDDDEFETLGGLMADRLERVPVVGDKVQLISSDRENNQHEVILMVERMDGRRVDRIRMEVSDEVIPVEGVEGAL